MDNDLTWWIKQWFRFHGDLVNKVFFVSCRAFEDEGKARLGVVECAKHELLQPFSVLNEKESQSHYHCGIYSCFDRFLYLVNLSYHLFLSVFR